MYFSSTQIGFFVAVLSMLIAISGLGFFIYHVHTVRADLSVREMEQRTMEAQLEARSAFARVLSETEIEREELAGYIIHQEEIIELLAQIETLGRSEGAVVSTVSIDTLPRDEHFEDLTIVVMARGSYVAVAHVLELLETVPYQSFVAKATVQKAPSSEETVGEIWEGMFTIVLSQYIES